LTQQFQRFTSNRRLRQIEVDKFDGCFLGAVVEDVFGLEVHVHDIVVVHVTHGRQHLLNNARSLFFKEVTPCITFLLDFAEELAAAQKLRHHEVTFFIFEGLVQSQNVAMVKFPQQHDLSHETIV